MKHRYYIHGADGCRVAQMMCVYIWIYVAYTFQMSIVNPAFSDMSAIVLHVVKGAIHYFERCLAIY